MIRAAVALVLLQFHAPVDRRPTRDGIDEPIPAGYLGPLRSPFVATRVRA